MRKAVWILLITLFFVSCPGATGPIDPVNPEDPVDSAFWFKDVYEALREREEDNTMGTPATCLTVCAMINNKWGTSFQPETGTENSPANCEYLLKMIDKANKGQTTFGTSIYASEQEVDVESITQAINTLWLPGGKFVAGSRRDSNNPTYSFQAANSIDGINWTATDTTLPVSSTWASVTYGNGKFVAVSGDGSKQAFCSTDGINWIAITLPASSDCSSVTYGNGKFVAVNSDGNQAFCSTDGINWIAATLPLSALWRSVTFGNGKFVAVNGGAIISDRRNKAAYSTDGITWTSSNLPSATAWRVVTYGNGMFVVVASGEANGNNQVARSTDGINWTASTLPVMSYWNHLVYGNGRFVTIGEGSPTLVYCSTDGINWKASTLPVTSYGNHLVYGNGRFVVFTRGRAQVIYSTDGMDWISMDTTLPSSNYFCFIAAYSGE